MRESRAWVYVRDHLPPWLAVERLEPMYPPGLPDCYWADMRPRAQTLPVAEHEFVYGVPLRPLITRTVSGWLELKYCEADDKEFRAGRIPKLRPTQPQFLRRQAANGVPGGVLLRVGMFEWFLWKARSDHAWITEMCSINAGKMAVSVSLGKEPGTVQAVAKLDFERVFNLLGTP